MSGFLLFCCFNINDDDVDDDDNDDDHEFV